MGFQPLGHQRGWIRQKPGSGLVICVILDKQCWGSEGRFISLSVVSDSLRPHWLKLTRLLCPWDSPGKNTGVGCHFLLQGIFPAQGLNLDLLHCRQALYCLSLPLDKTDLHLSEAVCSVDGLLCRRDQGSAYPTMVCALTVFFMLHPRPLRAGRTRGLRDKGRGNAVSSPSLLPASGRSHSLSAPK